MEFQGGKLKLSSWWKNLSKCLCIFFITFILFLPHESFWNLVLELATLSSRRWSSSPKTSSQLVEHQLGVDVGEHVELHPPVRRAAVATHHAVEVLVGADDLSHALRHWLNVVLGCSGVSRRVSVPLQLPMSHQYSSLWKNTNHIFSSLCIQFFSPSQF